ncbi:hypothetical protein [Pararhizobium sp.]|uniref:hypothetical protein n=1 Tax=Pararhizobium sp. TaxID=1977563 RepID=UPI002717A33A|nr:hypothetical protein [Pararhizobium sp.]MDO9417242.1 hypothetical protein [Pararhizobium sp.]
MPICHRAATFALALLMPAVAFASSDDAWEAMRADVSAKCLEATKDSVEEPKTVIDPFGSDHYGLALVWGRSKGGEVQVSYICVYDKKTKTVEIGSELTDGVTFGE